MQPEVPGPADVGPGSDATLSALYDLVPDAEVVDLSEEVRLEQEQACALERAGFLQEGAVPEPDRELVEEPPAPPPEERLSDGQVQGLLEHLLGAEVVDDDPQRGHET